jgi:hypothetical protein
LPRIYNQVLFLFVRPKKKRMKPFQANLLNAIVLIALGAWGYFGSENPSTTALIPVAFGLIFLLSTPTFRKGNRVVVHIIVLLTLLLVIALFRPLTSALDKDNTMAVVRVAIMMATSLLALGIFIKSFIDARRNKA